MKLHRKAKTTPASRLALVQRAMAGEAYAVIAVGMGISVRTVAKWVQRFRHGGVGALAVQQDPINSPIADAWWKFRQI